MIALSRAAQLGVAPRANRARNALASPLLMRRDMNARASIIAVFVSLAACGGKTTDVDDSGAPDAAADTAPNPNCPTAEPAEGDACVEEDLECEYGSDPRTTCNHITTCTSGHWSLTFGPEPSCPTPAQNPSACPSSLGAATGSCDVQDTICNYSTPSATLFCTCGLIGGPILVDGGANVMWYCTPTGQSEACPLERPRVGTACTMAAATCSYDVCGLPSGLAFQCSSETMTWVVGPGEVCAGAQ